MKETTLKTISLLLVVSCLSFIRCGSRNTDTQKNEKQEQKTETKIEYKDVFREVVKTVKDTVYLEQKTESKQETRQQKQRQKTRMKKEYYENGTLKSESEENTTESELINNLILENDYLKSSAIALKEENEKLEKKESAYQAEIQSLKERNKAKNTEREAYPWYFWVIGSIVAWEVLKWLLKFISKYYKRY